MQEVSVSKVADLGKGLGFRFWADLGEVGVGVATRQGVLVFREGQEEVGLGELLCQPADALLASHLDVTGHFL